MDKKLSNVKYELIASVSENLKEVMVTYTLNGQSHRYFVFVPKNNKKKDADYIKEAKTKFEADFKNGKIKPKKFKGGRNRPWLIATTCVLGVTTLALGGLFVWKMLADKESIVEKKVSYEEAQQWLDEHFVEAKPETTLQSADYSWDYSKSTGDSLKEIGMPFLITYFVDEASLPEIVEKAKEQTVKDFNYTGWYKGDENNSDIPIFMEPYCGKDLQEYIEDYTTEGKPEKCSVKGDNLYVTFKRQQEFLAANGDSYTIEIEETDVFNKDCQMNDIKLRLDDVQIDYSDGEIEFSGVANGYIDAHYNFTKFNSAHNWFIAHFNKTVAKSKISDTISWDFSSTTDETSKKFVLQSLSSVIGETITELKGEKTKLVPEPKPAIPTNPETFYDNYSLRFDALYEYDQNELHATIHNDFIDSLETLDCNNLYEITSYDNDCFKSSESAVFNHSESGLVKNSDITGTLIQKINYEIVK